jgi:hypothetical protein
MDLERKDTSATTSPTSSSGNTNISQHHSTMGLGDVKYVYDVTFWVSVCLDLLCSSSDSTIVPVKMYCTPVL